MSIIERKYTMRALHIILRAIAAGELPEEDRESIGKDARKLADEIKILFKELFT